MTTLPPACGEKQCFRCQQIKPLTQFSPNKGSKDGRHAYCKPCRNEQAKLRGAMGLRKDRPKRYCKPQAWPRVLSEALLDVSARKWRGPVNKGVLRCVA